MGVGYGHVPLKNNQGVRKKERIKETRKSDWFYKELNCDKAGPYVFYMDGVRLSEAPDGELLPPLKSARFPRAVGTPAIKGKSRLTT